MPNFQTFIAIVTALLVFTTSVFLAYDKLQFRNYTFIIPQWAGLLLAAITFGFVAVDQVLRGFVRLEEVQRQSEEVQRRAEEEHRRTTEEQRRAEEEYRRIAEEQRRAEEEYRRIAEEQRRVEEEQRRAEEARSREREIAQVGARRIEERNRINKAAECETRRTRIEARYRAVLIRFLLDGNPTHRRQLENVLALLEEYRDTL